MTIQIREHTDVLPERWDSFVLGHTEGTWYHQSAWFHLIKDHYGHQAYYLSAWSDDEMVGGLPLFLVHTRFFGRILVSIPYACYGGPCASNAEASEALIARAIELARNLKVDYLELRNKQALERKDLVSKDFKYTYALNLKQSNADRWFSLNKEIRQKIFKALELGCSVIHGREELMDEFYAIYCRRMKELGSPAYARGFFQRVLKQYEQKAHIILIRQGETVLAGGLWIQNGLHAELPWSASTQKYFSTHAVYLMYWRLMLSAVDAGCESFDFGTSNKGSGVEAFKLKWGMIPRKLGWQYWTRNQGPVPDLSPHNPRYSIAIAIWKCLPLKLTQWLGPILVKGLP